MNDLIKTEFFVMLNEDLQKITNEQMQCTYGKLITHIDTISQVENDLTGIIRKLNVTRIELVSLLKQFQDEQGEKCARTSLPKQSDNLHRFRIIPYSFKN
ncbi:hypothetical protein HMPREF9455_00516 [Dysgonomonas gadei ATCC BAA-286]|uniref:Uncharacterized protein n=1 Tax=Dysgonomonas gadei ATCC BAA-286 TaxID=742766 RepID=F5ITU9_9BACT|nr:hypothetical protein HMPREF9455_00516 [Dysgonomonas gadei ATCC BAA-286]